MFEGPKGAHTLNNNFLCSSLSLHTLWCPLWGVRRSSPPPTGVLTARSLRSLAYVLPRLQTPQRVDAGRVHREAVATDWFDNGGRVFPPVEEPVAVNVGGWDAVDYNAVIGIGGAI